MIPKATELRIGNIVRPLLKIKVLHEADFYGVNLLMLKDCLHYGEAWAFGAAELNGEWLKRFGFESVYIDDTRGEYHKRVGEWGIFVIDVDGNGYTYSNSACTIVTKLEYVHQLQNLFAAVTHTELDLNCEDDFLNSKTLDALNEETHTPPDANTMLADSSCCDNYEPDKTTAMNCKNCKQSKWIHAGSYLR